MRMYSTKLRIIVPIEIEAESVDEAERIIDGVLSNAAKAVIVYEGKPSDDTLEGGKPEITRDEIEIIHDQA